LTAHPEKRFSAQARTLQRIDRWAGSVACALLTASRRLADLLGSGSPERPVQSVLFLKLAEQGSTVLAHDAVRRAVERVGRDNVYFLVFEENRFIVDVLGLVPPGNVFTVRTRTVWDMAASAVSALRRIRRRGIDACIDMEFFARTSAAIAYLTGARVRVGFHVFFGEGPYRGDLMTHRVLYNPHLHTSRTFTSLVMALDADLAALPTFAQVPAQPAALPRHAPDAAEREAVARMLSSLGVPASARIVLLNANASDLMPLRRWAPDRYAQLARDLLSRHPGLWVVFTGSPAESGQIEALARSVGEPRAVCAAGRTSLRELLALYDRAEVLVTNDSGPAHFAALTTVDVVALFGPETPLLFAAPGPRSHPLWAGLACSPCINAFNNRQSACRDNQCMKAIGVDTVLSATEAILARRAAS
jgi:ADP-heptose:LPS heptosyltransferase